MRSLAQNDDVASALTECEPNVLKLFDCGGAAVFSRGVCHRLGHTPGEPELSRLVAWMRQPKGNEVLSSDALPSVYPAAEAFKDTASGILVVPILKASGDYILWMRPEMLRTVKWAGDPDKPMETGPMGDRLTPRKSFALWQDTVRGHGATWLTLELEAARKLRVAMVDVIQRRGKRLRTSTSNYRAATPSSTHLPMSRAMTSRSLCAAFTITRATSSRISQRSSTPKTGGRSSPSSA